MKHYTNRKQKVKQQIFFFKPNCLYFILHELKKTINESEKNSLSRLPRIAGLHHQDTDLKALRP